MYFAQDKEFHFGTVDEVTGPGKLLNGGHGTTYCHVTFDDGDDQDYTLAETRDHLWGGGELAEASIEVQYEILAPGNDFYVPERDATALPSQLHRVTENGSTFTFVLSVGPSNVPSAGRGVFFTLVHIDAPQKRGKKRGWVPTTDHRLGLYGSGNGRGCIEMIVKNFLFEGKPCVYAWKSDTSGRFFDVTDDATGEILKSAGCLPYMNERGNTKRMQRVVAKHNGDGSVAYHLLRNQNFQLNKRVELLVDYGHEYEDIRKSHPCYMNGQSDERYTASYTNVGSEIWNCSEMEVLLVLRMFLERPPEHSESRWRMNWVAQQIHLRIDKAFDQEGSHASTARMLLQKVKSLFPRDGNEEDKATATKNRFLGMWIQWNTNKQGRIEERIEPDDGSECRYLLRGFNGEREEVSETFVISKQEEKRCKHKRFYH
jgi:hypothetical protein